MVSDTNYSGSTALKLSVGEPLPAEILARVERERKFFDEYSNPAAVANELLRVPAGYEVCSEIEALLPQIQGKRICDYGCGYGISSAYLALQGALVHAFDVSENNVLIARRAAQVNNVQNRVTVQAMPGEQLAYPSANFDYVFGTGVLHHVDLAFAARELWRVLKPGGTAIFAEPLGENRVLEWLRRSPFWEANHRHSQDEHSLRYEDIRTLSAVFGGVTLRETGLLTFLKPVLRKVKIGMVWTPRLRTITRYLEGLDRRLLAAAPPLRPLACYVVLTLHR